MLLVDLRRTGAPDGLSTDRRHCNRAAIRLSIKCYRYCPFVQVELPAALIFAIATYRATVPIAVRIEHSEPLRDRNQLRSE